MAEQIIIGIDPSSVKIALVVTYGSDTSRVDANIYKLRKEQDFALRCGFAYKTVSRELKRLAARHPDAELFAFIEEPVVGRGGAYSTISQSKVHGAIIAACYCSGVVVKTSGVNNATAKKQIVGAGNASKTDIRRWAKVYWGNLEEQIVKFNKGDQQDIADAGMINRYGWKVVQTQNKLASYKNKRSVKRRRITRKV